MEAQGSIKRTRRSHRCLADTNKVLGCGHVPFYMSIVPVEISVGYSV